MSRSERRGSTSGRGTEWGSRATESSTFEDDLDSTSYLLASVSILAASAFTLSHITRLAINRWVSTSTTALSLTLKVGLGGLQYLTRKGKPASDNTHGTQSTSRVSV